MLLEDKKSVINERHGGRRTLSYHTQVAGVLAAAFALSLAY